MATELKNPKQNGKSTSASLKKPYDRPKLAKLGSLRDLTMSASTTGSGDGAVSGTKRKTGRGGLHS